MSSLKSKILFVLQISLIVSVLSLAKASAQTIQTVDCSTGPDSKCVTIIGGFTKSCDADPSAVNTRYFKDMVKVAPGGVWNGALADVAGKDLHFMLFSDVGGGTVPGEFC